MSDSLKAFNILSNIKFSLSFILLVGLLSLSDDGYSTSLLPIYIICGIYWILTIIMIIIYNLKLSKTTLYIIYFLDSVINLILCCFCIFIFVYWFGTVEKLLYSVDFLLNIAIAKVSICTIYKLTKRIF